MQLACTIGVRGVQNLIIAIEVGNMHSVEQPVTGLNVMVSASRGWPTPANFKPVKSLQG